MREFVYPEMMVHVPMCTHKAPQNVLVISNAPESLQKEVARHEGVVVVHAPASLEALREVADGSVDVVICEADVDAAVAGHINRVLSEDGVVSMRHTSLEEVQANTVLLGVLGNYFKVIMPYRLANEETLLLASKGNHPTADINLHRADMLDGLEYYNTDIHPAAFAMPNYIRKTYLGIIRN
ncbi:spermidine synthase [Sulfurimonas sp. HSL-1656]|uniref:spermine/spermidine synthase domain-containing protein n=1 Tax=Thiomicrolovo subterrani TaxID=3131934 RepID=UPI0031F7CEFD